MTLLESSDVLMIKSGFFKDIHMTIVQTLRAIIILTLLWALWAAYLIGSKVFDVIFDFLTANISVLMDEFILIIEEASRMIYIFKTLASFTEHGEQFFVGVVVALMLFWNVILVTFLGPLYRSFSVGAALGTLEIFGGGRFFYWVEEVETGVPVVLIHWRRFCFFKKLIISYF